MGAAGGAQPGRQRLRRARRRAKLLVRLGPAADVPALSVEALALTRTLRKLPPRGRQVLVLHHLVGLPVQEIARELGVPVGTVTARLSRARATLARLLAAERRSSAMPVDELEERLGALAEEGARRARPSAAATIGRRSRRRRQRQAAGVVLLGLALAGAVVVARASWPMPSVPVAPPTPTTQAPAFPGGIVPWSSAPPRPPAPARPAAVPPGTPACTADRLHATAGWEGATGSLAGWVRVTSRAGASCRLGGFPAIQLLDQQGRALPTRTGRAGRGQVTRVLVRPGTAATVTFVWRNWCGPNPGRLGLRVTLPGDGTLLPAVQAGTPRGLVARCDAPGAPSTLSRGPFAPELPEPPPSPLDGLTATIALPPTTVAGRPLRYTVTLANPTDRPISLRDCPNYTEAVLLGDHGKAVERHLLNCAPVGAIGPGQRVRFAMVLKLPARLRPGVGVLTWVVERVGVGQKVPVTVTAP